MEKREERSSSLESPVPLGWTPDTSPQLSSTVTSPIAGDGGIPLPPPTLIDENSETKQRASSASSSTSSKGDPSSSPPPQQQTRKLTPADFEFSNELGIGSFSRVVLGKRTETQEIFAIKIMPKRLILREKKENNVKMERDVMNFLSHPNIIQLYSTFQDPTFLYMAFEYAPGGELFEILQEFGTISFELGRFYAAEIVNALEYMHGMNVIHRDLKPENILIAADNHLKLSDFGTATFVGQSVVDQFCGTAEYVSPEVLESQGASFASDLWALGCILFQFFAGRVPFKGESQYLTFQLVLAGKFEFPEWFCEEMKDIVSRLLVADKSKRLGAKGEQGEGTDYPALKTHAFFNGIEFEGLHLRPVPPRQQLVDKSLVQVKQQQAALLAQQQQEDMFKELSRNSRQSSTSVESGTRGSSSTAGGGGGGGGGGSVGSSVAGSRRGSKQKNEKKKCSIQ